MRNPNIFYGFLSTRKCSDNISFMNYFYIIKRALHLRKNINIIRSLFSSLLPLHPDREPFLVKNCKSNFHMVEIILQCMKRPLLVLATTAYFN